LTPKLGLSFDSPEKRGERVFERSDHFADEAWNESQDEFMGLEKRSDNTEFANRNNKKN